MKPRALLFVLLLTAAMGAFAQSAEQVPEELRLFQPGTRIATYEDWENLLDATNKLEWQANDVTLRLTDFKGNKLDFGWAQTTLPAETKAKLEELHEKAKQASAAGDAKALKAALDEAKRPIDEQRRAAMLTYGATMSMLTMAYHQFTLKPWLQLGTDADRAAADQQLRDFQTAVGQVLSAALKSSAWDESFGRAMLPLSNKTWAAFNNQRKRLVSEHPDQDVLHVPAKVRDKACTPPQRPKSDPAPGDRPGISSLFPSAEDYYPPLAKRVGIDGPVIVRALVSEMGCAQRAEIARTSGVRELDEGALDLALNGVYVPRVHDGQPVPGEIVFRINFELRD